MKIIETIVDFVLLSAIEKEHFFQKIWAFDQQIFPHATVEQLSKYINDPDAVSVPVVQYHCNGKLVGLNIISILKLQLANHPILLVSSRAGFLPEYRGKNQSLNSALRTVLNYRIRHPVYPMWFVASFLQPKVYTLFASHSINFFPRAGRAMPEKHAAVLDMMQSRLNDVQSRGRNIWVHRGEMPVLTPEQLVRLRSQANSHHQFFMQYVPDYFDGMGLMCICRLDLRTIFETAFNLAIGRRIN